MIISPDEPVRRRPALDVPLASPQEQSWNQAFENIGVAAAYLAPDGVLLAVNHRFCELTGYQKAYFVGRNFRDFFLHEGLRLEDIRLLRSVAMGELPQYSTDMYVRTADGEIVWFNTVFSPILTDSGDVLRNLTLAASDITSLKQTRRDLRDSEFARHELSRRMMDAQEADRTRIARELHDDIGQSLAILKIQFLRAGQPVSGDQKKRHADLRELAGKMDSIIQRVSRISHGLHSSELEFMGLAAALQSHCRECSAQLGIAIQCQCDEVEKTLNGIVGLAFLRVLQESLHNAAKHSRATCIIVKLNGSSRDLTLQITDDGVGFDPEATRLAAGLGLISMRERIHLIGGEFDIDSSPGYGTKISVRVPFAKNESFTGPPLMEGHIAIF